jgi:hypothetical protein
MLACSLAHYHTGPCPPSYSIDIVREVLLLEIASCDIHPRYESIIDVNLVEIFDEIT